MSPASQIKFSFLLKVKGLFLWSVGSELCGVNHGFMPIVGQAIIQDMGWRAGVFAGCVYHGARIASALYSQFFFSCFLSWRVLRLRQFCRLNVVSLLRSTVTKVQMITYTFFDSDALWHLADRSITGGHS